jgi:hypothetical protein
MSDLQVQGRKVFKVFNQDFVVDDRYTVTKELGQGAYGIVWYVLRQCPASWTRVAFVIVRIGMAGLCCSFVSGCEPPD